MNTNDEHREILFDRYINGLLSPEELSEMEQWLAEDANKAVFESWKKANDRLSSFRASKSFEPDVDMAWKKVRARIHNEDPPQSGRLIDFRNYYPALMRVAAVLVIALGAFLLFKLSSDTPSTGYAGIEDPNEVVVAENTNATFEMQEGTKIQLKKNSRIVVKSGENDDLREVELTGEAFFEVARNEAKPFVVHSGDAVVRVLGTSFLVKTKADSTVLVYVEEGTVMLFSNDQPTMEPTQFVKLEKGETGELSRSGRATKKKAGRFNLMSWFTGTLKFKEAPMSTVVSDLQDYFEISIEVKDPAFKQCKLTARFKDKTIEEVMESLKLTFDIEVQKRDGRYIINGKGC